MLRENEHVYALTRTIAWRLHPLWAAATADANSYLVPSAHLCGPLLQSPAASVGLASETRSRATRLHGIQPQTEACGPRAVAALARSGRCHQCGSLDCPSAQIILRSVLKQKTKKALERAQEEWSVRMKISLVTNFSSESLHYSTNYFHFMCRLIYPGLVSSDTDDRSPDLVMSPDIPYPSKRCM